jgi:hypothetical protein
MAVENYLGHSKPSHFLQWPMKNGKWKMENLLSSLDTQLLSQLKLQPIHFAFVSQVIITAKVQQPMKDKLRDLVIQTQLILFSLARSLLY